jgi:rhodanese-related sulfurtransferase
MIKRFLFLASLVFIFGCKKTPENNDQTKVISQEEMQTLLQLDDVQLVDVRTPKEFSEGYIENAINIDFLSPDFDKGIQRLDKEKPVIVYCRSGKRSGKCSKVLVEAGFKKIYDLEGGFSKWKQEEEIKN